MLTDAVLEVGLDTLTAGRPAFLNLTKPLITSQVATLLPHAAAVYELREDVEVDDSVVEACRDLHARGYRLALDDFVVGSDAEQLMQYVSFVKIDVQLTEMPLVLELPRSYKARTGHDGGREGRDARGVRRHAAGRLHAVPGLLLPPPGDPAPASRSRPSTRPTCGCSPSSTGRT